MTDHTTPFGTWAQIYRDRGFWPRPLKYPGMDKRGKPYGKACIEPNWTTPDPALPPGTTEGWDEKCALDNIGLLLGSPFPDGTVLGALDVDHDHYVNLARTLLGNAICGRIGSKGIGIFVRALPNLMNRKIRVKGEFGDSYGQVLECFFRESLFVIPPSIHPVTRQPYIWTDKPLHEVDFNQLPLIGE